MEMICRRWLVLSYKIRLVILNVVTKFQNSSLSSSSEGFDRNLIGEKKKNLKYNGTDKQ